MDVQVAITLPKDVLSAIKKDPKDFVRELKIAASVKWFELGIVSQEKAAKIAGLSRKEFIDTLATFKVSPFQYNMEEIKEEIFRG